MNDRFQNSWHNVRGVSIAELADNEREALRKYGDIISLPHPVSKKHKSLSRESRAAQFSPFAALTGLEKVMSDTADEAACDYANVIESEEVYDSI